LASVEYDMKTSGAALLTLSSYRIPRNHVAFIIGRMNARSLVRCFVVVQLAVPVNVEPATRGGAARHGLHLLRR